MDSAVEMMLGAFGALAVLAAFRVRSLPRFKADSFKARPEAEQRRSIRIARIVLVFAAVILLGASFASGFVKGLTGARSNQAVAKSVFDDVMRKTTALEAEFSKVEESLTGLLDPARMITAEGNANARKGLARYAEAIKRLEDGKKDLARETEQKLEQLNMSSSAREEMLGNFRRSRDQSLKMLGELMRAKRDLMLAFVEMLDLTQTHRGKVAVQDGGLVFSDAADARRSGEIGAKLKDAAEREERIGQQLVERTQGAQKKAQEVFGK